MAGDVGPEPARWLAPDDLVDAVIAAEGLDPASNRHRSEMVEQAERIFGSPIWSTEP